MLIFEGINYYFKAPGKLLRQGKILGLNLNFSSAFFCWCFQGYFAPYFLGSQMSFISIFQRSCLFFLPNCKYTEEVKLCGYCLFRLRQHCCYPIHGVDVFARSYSFSGKEVELFFWCSSGNMFAKDENKKLLTATNIQNIVEEIGRIKFQNVESRIAPHENKCRSHDFISCQILRIFQPLLINVLF